MSKYYGKDVRSGNGRIVRMLRERLDLTQSMLAKTLGISSAMVGAIERGTAKLSDAHAATLVAKFDGLTMENFTEDKPVEWSKVC